LKVARPWAGVPRRAPRGVVDASGDAGGNGSRGMGVPGGDVHPPAVRGHGPGNRSSFGRGPGFFAPVLEGAERPEGPGQKRAAGTATARGFRKRHGNGWAAPEPGGSGASGGSGAGIGLWRRDGPVLEGAERP
jgi:hypothetical protein